MTKSYSVNPVSRDLAEALQQRMDSRTKPIGSLGLLEPIALQAGLIQNTVRPVLNRAGIMVFAGDHGAARAGVGAYPQEVTMQMVANFLNNGAAINILTKEAGLEVSIVDCGMAGHVPEAGPQAPAYLHARIGDGTRNYIEEAAMTAPQRDEAIANGIRLVKERAQQGCNAIGFGEMGIGNTASASLITHFLTGAALHDVVGRGAGLDDAGLARKRDLLARAAARVSGQQLDAESVLAEFGGFEIATMTGAFIGAAQAGMLIVVDGFIVTSALLVAHALAPNVLDYCVFAHGSAEPGHQAQLRHLRAHPLLNLGMRLGEGTGAATAFPLIRAGIACMNEMAGFEDAGVSTANA